MDELNSLIERIEKAEAGSRELDAEIWKTAQHRDWAWHHIRFEGPTFTTSIDAAMTLVPKDFVSIHGWDYQGISQRAIFMDEDGDLLFRGKAVAPALALCAAALRARQGTTTIEGDG